MEALLIVQVNTVFWFDYYMIMALMRSGKIGIVRIFWRGVLNTLVRLRHLLLRLK
jgi:hypothetical protein